MKVLILCNHIGGLLSFRQEVVRAMIEDGHEVVISAPSSDRDDEVWALGCLLVSKGFNRRGTNPIKDLELVLYYVRLIKRIKPDVILSYTIKPNVYGGMASRITKVPLITNITGLGSAVESSGWLRYLTIALYRIGLRQATCLFFQNEYNRDFFYEKMFQPRHYRLIPGSGVNLTRYLFREYPMEGDLQFAFIGRILKEKGVEEYLYVAEAIRQEYPEAVFHVLGEFGDDYYRGVISEYSRQGIIYYHGDQKDIRPFLAQCCCTIHPSYYPEGMSNVCLETQATGRPVITTDRIGCKDTVEDGVTGSVVKQRDKEELLEAVRKFISLRYTDKKQMGLNARRRMERLFDRTIVVNAYLEEIYSII